MPIHRDPVLRASLLPEVLGLAQNSRDPEGQTIPSASKGVKWASNSKKFNENTKDSRSWLHHLWSGVALLGSCGSGQKELVFKERKLKWLSREKQK